jgi:phosphoribosylformylglycinamidine synthase subunit PurQ / glutaminase
VSARIAVPVFPGTNSEDETVRLLRDCGGDAELVHWSQPQRLAEYDAYVLSGGFAYEDRIRAGAIAAHDRILDFVIDGASAGKLVFGICNGAQILLEAGLVPGTNAARRPTAAFAKNAPEPHFVCRHVYMKLAIEPSRCAITAALVAGTLVPAWAAHAEGRLAATPEHLDEIVTGDHLAFVYANADGTVNDAAVPNGSALRCAGLVNRSGNVLAIMPHPERDGWNFNHLDRREGEDVLAPSGGVLLFRSFVQAASA